MFSSNALLVDEGLLLKSSKTGSIFLIFAWFVLDILRILLETDKKYHFSCDYLFNQSQVGSSKLGFDF